MVDLSCFGHLCVQFLDLSRGIEPRLFKYYDTQADRMIREISDAKIKQLYGEMKVKTSFILGATWC